MHEDDIVARNAAVQDGRCPERLGPLADGGGELRGLLIEGPIIVRFSACGLLSATYRMLYDEVALDVSIAIPSMTSRRRALHHGDMVRRVSRCSDFGFRRRAAEAPEAFGVKTWSLGGSKAIRPA